MIFTSIDGQRMKVTQKQLYVLENLHRIVFSCRREKERTTLDGEDCRYQLVGLAARQVIAWDRRGRPVKIAEPDEITAHAGRVRRLIAAE